MQQKREASVDVARGLACVLMVQTHAFHGWVAPAFQGDPSYLATRWLGSFALPGFLVLVGVSVALRVRVAVSGGEGASSLRRSLAARGLFVLAVGYATNLAWGLLDGARSAETFLRADVLHVIGVSVLALSLLVRGDKAGRVDPRWLSQAAIVGALLLGVLCPFVARMSFEMTGPLRYLVALLSDVQGVTAMPLLPLGACCGFGVAVGLWLTARRDAQGSQRAYAIVGVVGVVSMVLGSYATGVATALLQQPLSRLNASIWPNLVDCVGRGLVVLACGAWFARAFGQTSRRVLSRLGAASLTVYVVHIPFCYGRLALPLRRSLSPELALPLVLLLLVACYGLVVALASMKARSRGAAVLRSSA